MERVNITDFKFARVSITFIKFFISLVLSRLLDAEDERMEAMSDDNEVDGKSGLTVEEKEIIFRYFNR